MKTKNVKNALVLAVAGIWLMLSFAAWLRPSDNFSDTERRPLAQFPGWNADSMLDGSFMSDFEDYTLDQFPLRNGFRQLKAMFHYKVMGQLDNNGIYLSDGCAAKLEYPLNTQSVANAAEKFAAIYDQFLRDQGSNVYLTIVPDKSYYLAEDGGYPAMDYDALIGQLREAMPYASYVNLTDCLSAEDYYRTDTHWRQENLLDAASRLCEALGIPSPNAGDYTLHTAQEPFYGVYYGQAALPLEPDALCWLQSDLLDSCWVLNYETGEYSDIYDKEKIPGKDLYEVFLSGPVSLLTIENPQAETDRELVIFRDSFGSSMAPLLVQGYRTVTLIDIRYISRAMLDRFVDFHGQDVLFLYSTLVLNNSETLQ
ncbi:MAG: DHHW family protein [Faecousia sp.]